MTLPYVQPKFFSLCYKAHAYTQYFHVIYDKIFFIENCGFIKTFFVLFITVKHIFCGRNEFVRGYKANFIISRANHVTLLSQ